MDRKGIWRSVLLACLVLQSPLGLADWRTDLPGARLAGSAEFTWFGFSLYQANLWRTDGASGQPDMRQPFALELVYSREISREALVDASVEEISRLSGAQVDDSSLARWRSEMQAAFVDVTPGQRITGVYLPGRGCRFYVDGRLSREIADPAFARAFFAIWLAPGTRNPELRRELLGLNP